jgi:tetratricopeptide (TPR) repeat protein
VQLLQAENKYVGPEHRQRTLYASIDISVRYLDTELRTLFSGLWIFHAPFLPETALAIFDPKTHYPEVENSPIYNYLHKLWLRGLLIRYNISLGEETLLFYHLLSTIRLYVEQKMEQVYERDTLLAQFGGAYLRLAGDLFSTLDQNAKAIVIIQQALDDFEKAIHYVDAEMKPYYLFWLGSILNSTGNPRKGLELLEKALELAQGYNRLIESQALNTMGIIYQNTGQPHQALLLHEQALPIMLEGNRSSGVAATLNNMGHIYLHMGYPDVALQLYQHALPITREVEDYVGEATTLNNMGQVYQEIGNTETALQLYQQALQLSREHADPSGEATPLNNIALIYQRMENFEKALRLYQQALQLLRDGGDRTREAETLNNIASLYQETGHPREALQLYQQILPMMMEVENRTGEAAALNGLAYSLRNLHRYTESLEAYEQSIELARQTAHYIGEVASRVDLSILLYEDLDLPQEAINQMKQAIVMLQKLGLTQDAAGHTIEDLSNLLEIMRAGVSNTVQADDSEDDVSDLYIFLIHNTLAVLGPNPEKKKEWHDTLLELKNMAMQDDADKLTALLTTVIDLLNAGGNPEGLGTNLEGKQAQVWETLVAHLTSN